MKRSAQVALVLMGVTGTTATAAYMMPPHAECRPQQPAPPATPAMSTTASPATALPPGVTPRQPSQPCGQSYRSSYHSWGDWHWNSNRQRTASTGVPPGSVSTAFTSSGGRVGAVSSTSTSTSSSTVARGGFGSTGHAVAGGGSGS